MAITIPRRDVVVPAHGSSIAQKAIFQALAHLMEQWKFNEAAVAEILHLHPNTVRKWVQDASVPLGEPPFSPSYEAVLHLLAIHRSLSAMFSKPENQVVWLRDKHPELESTPLERMKDSIEGLILVRQYLDYVRGRGA